MSAIDAARGWQRTFSPLRKGRDPGKSIESRATSDRHNVAALGGWARPWVSGCRTDIIRPYPARVQQARGRSSSDQHGQTCSIRSGDFVAGNVTDLKSTGTLTKKIYWLPNDPAIAKTAKLTVVVADAAAPDKSVVTQRFGDGIGRGSIPSDGSTVSRGTLLPGSKVDYFWPSGIRFPGHGKWQLTATAPAHWGCFVVSI